MDKQELFEELNDSLTDYIAIHDYIIKQRFLQEVDYYKAVKILNNTAKRIIVTKNALCRILPKDKSEVVTNYTNALLEAMKQLIKIIKLLEMKADRTGKYSYLKYRKDLKRYDELVNGYLQYGRAINDLAREEM